MAQILLLCFILTVTDAFLGLTMASQNFSNLPAPSPFGGENSYYAQAPISRKLGKHHLHKMVFIAPTGETPSAANKEETSGVQGLRIQPINRHRSLDKSIAGGGVILGGLAATFFVAVFCYIRATRRHKPETNS